MKKIIIVGTTGSGKSTFAKRLVQKLDMPYIQLDFLFWKPNWKESRDEEFFKKVEHAVDNPCWILDGNYARTNHLTWTQADTVIWIDRSFWVTFYLLFKRALQRAISRKELWEGTGNKESFFRMFSKDSILLWLFKTYDSNILKYQARMEDPQFAHIKFYRLRSNKEIAHFLKNL